MSNTSMPHGFKTDIFPGLWKRVISNGMPRTWFTFLLLGGMIEAMAGFRLLGAKLGLAIAAGLILLQFLLLSWMTAIDMQWDDIHSANLRRRYKSYYDA